MAALHGQLMTQIIRLANTLPDGTVTTLADVIAAGHIPQWNVIRLQTAQVVPQPHLRAAVLEMLAVWEQQAADVAPAEIALMLRVAAATTYNVRETQKVELVWTGPLTTGAAMRRTDQALLQVINSAYQSLLIVSFAVYKITAIATAIVRAAERGVRIRICVEAPEPSGQKMAYDTITALGSGVAQRAAIYVWPSDKRPRDAQGKIGVLHAKCAVADSRLLFVSSANLTDYAMNINMELGTLIHGGSAPGTVVTQFEHLIATGVLKQIGHLS